MNIDLRLGDCLEVLKTISDNSIDSVVTDPPYGLSFMGKKWDYDVPSVEVWNECLRVLKPGGHLLSFAGSRTYHRMAVRIEDAGFEIRDQIMWVYGSGFPKSHNIGKAIDKIEGNSEWEGWGTALKPAHEPIVMARKPLSEKSIAENVLKHGTGGINIDGSRIELEDKQSDLGRFPANIIFDEEAGQLLDEQSGDIKGGKNMPPFQGKPKNSINFTSGVKEINRIGYNDKGGASRFFYCPKTSKKDRNEGLVVEKEKNKRPIGVAFNNEDHLFQQGNGNNHPTVKPTDLMRYLINLITPPNGTILDPFMGSGSTGKAAVRAGFNFIGVEKEQEYMDIANARIEHEKNKPVQKELFD
jgi:site-specific DNA-methyltransferase (adenine-specific)